jgi:hypothetical protein
MKTIILQTFTPFKQHFGNSTNRLPSPCRSLLVPLLVACFALLPVAHAVVPAPDGGYPGGNTAEGDSALLSLTTGTYNTAAGIFSLLSNTEGTFNTALGAGTLLSNINANRNTATGAGALLSSTGSGNTANGAFALFANTAGSNNTAVGSSAMSGNTTGSFNVAIGEGAGFGLTSGSNNTIVGEIAGGLITTASGVICIGNGGGNVSNSCFIGHIQNQPVGSGQNPHFVLIDDTGKLGTVIVGADGNKMEALQPQAMLNELRKEQKRVAELEGTVARLAATVKEQAAQIQKVSAQLDVSKPAAQVVSYEQ